MSPCRHFGFFVTLVSILQGCAGTPAEPSRIERISAEQLEAKLPQPHAALPLEQVVQLSREGVAADELIARIAASASRYRLSATQIVELASQGVPLAVLDHVVAGERQRIFDDMAVDASNRDRACRERIDQELRMCRNELSGPLFIYGPFGPYPGINCFPFAPGWPYRR